MLLGRRTTTDNQNYPTSLTDAYTLIDSVMRGICSVNKMATTSEKTGVAGVFTEDAQREAITPMGRERHRDRVSTMEDN